MKTIETLNRASLLAITCILLFACKAQKQNQANTTKLINTDYAVTHLGEKDVTDEKLTMEVDTEAQRVSGFAGCNNYKFKYDIDNEGVLDLGYIVSTKMYCEDSMDLERNFFKQIGRITNFKIQKEHITFLSENGTQVIKAQKAKDSE